MGDTVHVLFVSRRGSMRSTLAQACLQHVGQSRFKGHACGLPGQVAVEPHPAALSVLHAARFSAPGGAPRSMNDFLRSGAPRMDFVITLDEKAAALAPSWPHQPETAVWPCPDLLATGPQSPELEQRAMQLLHLLRRRLEILSNLPLRGVDKAALRSDLRDMAFSR